MAGESSRAKKDYLKYNLRANIHSPTFFVKQFSKEPALTFGFLSLSRKI